jgi:hypothetical protein
LIILKISAPQQQKKAVSGRQPFCSGTETALQIFVGPDGFFQRIFNLRRIAFMRRDDFADLAVSQL